MSQIDNLLNISVGCNFALFVNMAAKFIGSKVVKTVTFDLWEFFAFAICLVLTIILYFFSLWVPNERNDIISKIKNHFRHHS